MSIERGKDVSWVFKIIIILAILAVGALIAFFLGFPLDFIIGLIIGVVIALLIMLVLTKMPKIYVKVSKY